jgi:hypothetical protein
MKYHFANGGYIIIFNHSKEFQKHYSRGEAPKVLDYRYLTNKINSAFSKELWDKCKRLFFRSQFTKFTVRASIKEYNVWTGKMLLHVRFEAHEHGYGNRLRPFRKDDNIKGKKLEFVYKPPVSWEIQRLLWIGKLKNGNLCNFAKLPHDMIKLVISFV